jgi:CAAX protease family protein
MTDAASPWRKLRALLEILAVIVGLFVTAALLGALATPHLPPALVTPVMALGLWGAVATGGLLLKLSNSSYRTLGFRRPASWLKTLGWAALAVAIAELGGGALGAIIKSVTSWPALDVTYIRASIQGDAFVFAVWIVLVVWGSAAFGEELFARGFVLDRLQIVFGRGAPGIVLAVLMQAALFGALHAIQGPSGVVITAFVGIVFAGVYFASGRNLWAPILAHGLTDTIGLTLIYLGGRAPAH